MQKQGITKKFSVFITKKGTSEVNIIGEEELLSEFGVTPKQFIDLKALQGDTSDNIPGVAGVGPKTALSLIQKYGDLDGIYNNIDEITGKTKEKLVADKEMAYLSKKLATILTTGSIELSLDKCEYDFPFSGEVLDFFKHYQFKSLISKENIFSKVDSVSKETFELVKVSSEEILISLEK